MAVQQDQHRVRVGRVAAELRNRPNSVQVVDNPWYDAPGGEREMFAVRLNGADLIVRAIGLSLSGAGPSVQGAIDDAATRHVPPEDIVAEWIDADPNAAAMAARLVIRLARDSGDRPDESWHGHPISAKAPVSRYPPRVERWGHVVDYDSGRDEQWDFVEVCESVEDAQRLFQQYARET